MDRFWTAVALLLLLGIVLVVTDTGDREITFYELETECRYDRGQKSSIQLNPDNSLEFSGGFHVNNPEADLGYSYSRSGRSIRLDVKASDMPEPENFGGGCLGLAVYGARTSRLPQGLYVVKVFHDGRQVEEQGIRIR